MNTTWYDYEVGMELRLNHNLQHNPTEKQHNLPHLSIYQVVVASLCPLATIESAETLLYINLICEYEVGGVQQ
jgi:hypothetical protein